MKIAIISDIHGNLSALESTFRSIDENRCDRTVCLGDIVGYGARPNECISMLRERNVPSLLGNHDAAAVGRLDHSFLNNFARAAIEWTINALTPDSKTFLGRLELTTVIEGFHLVHSTPERPEEWRYLFNDADAQREFRAFAEPICFFGHTHFPMVFTHSSGKRLINVGSVGQPRDRDPRACYGVIDSESGSFRWERVEYPIEVTQREILDANLPAYLAERLAVGR